MPQHPDPSVLIRTLDLQYPLIGLYDAPDPKPFELMGRWLEHKQPYRPRHPHLIVGPLREEQSQYQYLVSVTFFVNPDQLSTLMVGAQYHAAPGDPLPVIAPFGSGCSLLLPPEAGEDISQAMIGATDLAMRKHLPPDILAFTATKKLFARLCELAADERSYLYKSFFTDLQEVRDRARTRDNEGHA